MSQLAFPMEMLSFSQGRSSEVTEFVTLRVTESDASTFDRVLQKDCVTQCDRNQMRGLNKSLN